MEGNVKDRLFAAMRRAEGADYCDVRLEDVISTTINYSGPVLQRVGRGSRFGGCVRVLKNGAWGFASFADLTQLEEMVATAARQARILAEVVKGQSTLAPVPVVEDRVSVPHRIDHRTVPLKDKLNLMERYNRLMLEAGAPIVSSVLNYFDKHMDLYFASSEGSFIRQEKSDLAMACIPIASDGQTTQNGTHYVGSTVDYGVVLGQEERILEAVKVAKGLVTAAPAEGGEYTVVLGPGMSGVFIHEAFGHLSEGDNVYEDENLRQIMTMGTRFGSDILNVYDTGLDEGARGYMVYDDEGVRTEKTYLIRNGVLCGRLHNRETAGKMGERPTGNGRAINTEFPPIPRMRNTTIEPGETTFEEMISDVKLGIYAVVPKGGMGGEMFTFGCNEAYMIRDGRVAELVRGATLTGNLFTTLKNIDRVGNDRTSDDGTGGCGKGEQFPLAVSHWCPHIRIQKVLVGGGR